MSGLLLGRRVGVEGAVGAEVVTLIWVKEISFEVIALRPAWAVWIAVPVRADDEFVPAVRGVFHRSGIALIPGRPN